MKRLVLSVAALGIAGALAFMGLQGPERAPKPSSGVPAPTAVSDAHYTDVPIEARTIAVKTAELVAQGDIRLAYSWAEATAHDLGCKVGLAIAPISARSEREVKSQLKPMVEDISANLRSIQDQYVTDGPVAVLGEFVDTVKVPDHYGKRAHGFVLVVALACPR